jgi:S-adenosyl methyltransferase
MASQARIVYVNNDPLVLVHARASLTDSNEGAPTMSAQTCTAPAHHVRGLQDPGLPWPIALHSECHPSAVDHEVDTADIAGLLRGQE